MEERIPAVQRRTYDAVFRHPAPTDLDWRAIRSLLAALSKSIQENNGNTRFARRGRMLTIQSDRHVGPATAEHVMMVRRFLEGPTSEHAATAADGSRLMVVLDTREGRVYRVEPRDGAPERVEPYDPRGAGRALYYLQDQPDVPRHPDRESFHEAIARTLRGATSIVVLGRGKAAEGAVQQLLANLRRHHSAVAERVSGSATLQEDPTPQQLLLKAREFLGKAGAKEAALPPAGQRAHVPHPAEGAEPPQPEGPGKITAGEASAIDQTNFQ